MYRIYNVFTVFTEFTGYTSFTIYLLRSSHQGCSIKKGVLKNFAKFTGKQLRQSLFFNKVAVVRPETLLKKKL